MPTPKKCDECGSPATSEPIKDGRRKSYLCDDCLWALAVEIAEGLWGLCHFSGPPESPPTDDDRWRMLCGAFICLNQRVAADVIARDKLDGMKIPWKEDL